MTRNQFCRSALGVLAAGCVLVTSSWAAPAKDIVATAQSAGSFKTLVKALTAADLVKVLQGKGPFTVFAPTDAAFAKLPPAELQALLKDKAKLTKVLTYHVVAGKNEAVQVTSGAPLTTIEGGILEPKVEGSTVTLGGSKIVTADIQCSNGVIHVIDTVLMPK